jgi:hypothetical protein
VSIRGPEEFIMSSFMARLLVSGVVVSPAFDSSLASFPANSRATASMPRRTLAALNPAMDFARVGRPLLRFPTGGARGDARLVDAVEESRILLGRFFLFFPE